MHGEPESGAVASSTLDSDLSAHCLTDLSRDCQPQSGSPVLPGRGLVSLRERVEETRSLVLGNPDAGVFDGAAEGESLTTRSIR